MVFKKSLSASDKFPVKFLASLYHEDQRTVYGKILLRIRMDCASLPGQLKKQSSIIQYPVTEAELWRPNLLKNLLDIRDSKAVLPSFSVNEDRKSVV